MPPRALVLALALLAVACVADATQCHEKDYSCSSGRQAMCYGHQLWGCPSDCYCGGGRCKPKEPKCRGNLRNYDCTSADSFCLGGISMKCAPGTFCGANRGAGSPCYITRRPKRCHNKHWQCVDDKHYCLHGHQVKCRPGQHCHGWGPCMAPMRTAQHKQAEKISSGVADQHPLGNRQGRSTQSAMAETNGAWPAAIEAEHAWATAALDMPLLEGQAAVVQPRVYQLELLALAMKHNVIAFLDTGAGKTFVAVLLIRHCIAKERRVEAAAAANAAAAAAPARPLAPACAARDAPRKAVGAGAARCAAAATVAEAAPHRVAVFLAPKVALVVQQAEVLRAHFGASRVAHFVGENGLDLFAKDRWRAAFRAHSVVVATPQILLNLLTHGIIKASLLHTDQAFRPSPGPSCSSLLQLTTLSSAGCADSAMHPLGRPQMCEIHLLVFDECHHCTSNHPYNRIMQTFYHSHEALLAPRPHIFGLTAVPASAQMKAMRTKIGVLEANLDARVAPPPELRVASYRPTRWEGTSVAVAERLMGRARARLRLEWTRSLQRQLGCEGVAPTARRIYFDSWMPGLTVARLNSLLGKVELVLKELGPYCGALCAVEVFATLVQNPGGGGGASLAGPAPGLMGRNGSRPAAEAAAAEAASAVLADGAEEGEIFDSDEAAPVAMQLSVEDAAVKEAALVEAVMQHGFEVAEVQSEQVAACHSILEVLEGFAALFGTQDASAPCAAPASCQHRAGAAAAPDSSSSRKQTDVLQGGAGETGRQRDSKAASSQQSVQELLHDVRRRVAHGQMLGSQPLLAMRAMLAHVTPMQLQLDVQSQLPHEQALAAARAAIEAVEAVAAAAAASRGIPVNQDLVQKQLAADLAAADSSMPPFHLVSPKLAALAGQLMQYRAAAAATAVGSPSWCGIVFVTQRMSAWAEQSRILRRFRAGNLNLLVSTSVAEEGIDVKSCQLVSYIQSRGRARMLNSELVMMVEEGVEEQLKMVERMGEYELLLREEVLHNIDRLQAGALDAEDDDDEPAQQADHDLGPVYEVEASGAKVTLDNAQVLLNNYTSRLPEQLGDHSFRSRVFMPSNCPLPWADGELQPTRKAAVAAAALQACKQLHQLGALNDHLLAAVIDDGRAARRAMHSPKSAMALPGRKRLAEPDELLANKAHEALPQVVIEAPQSGLLKGCLRGLLDKDRAMLHCYRWQVTGGASSSSANPQLRELLTSLEQLGLMLPDPLPRNLPGFSLAAPGADAAPPAVRGAATAAARGASGAVGAAARSIGGGTVNTSGGPGGSSRSSNAGRLEIRLVPFGIAELSRGQLQQLLDCGSVLLAQMLSQGSYIGAAGKLIGSAARQEPVAASTAAQAADALTQQPAGKRPEQPPRKRARLDPGASPSVAATGTDRSEQLLSKPTQLDLDTSCSPAALREPPQDKGPQPASAGSLAASLRLEAPDKQLHVHVEAPQARQSGARHTPAKDAAAAGAHHTPAKDAAAAGASHTPAKDAAAAGAHHTPAKDAAAAGASHTPAKDAAAAGAHHTPAKDAAAAGPPHTPAKDAAAAGGPPEKAETGASADKSGSRSKKRRLSAAEDGDGAGDTGFLIVPLLSPRDARLAGGRMRQWQGRGARGFGRTPGTFRASTASSSINWAAVREIAGSASFGGSLLDWLRQQGRGQAAGRGYAAGGTGSSSDTKRLGVADGLTINARFDCNDPQHAAGKKPKKALPSQGDTTAAPAEAAPSPQAANTPAAPQVTTYARYYASRWGQRNLDGSQVLLNASRVSRQQLTRGLDMRQSSKQAFSTDADAKAATDEVHLLPQLCIVHPVPIALWRPLGTLPALLWQLEGALLGNQLRGKLLPAGTPSEKAPSIELLRTTMTAKSALESNDYERLETLGDAFLKFAVSAQLFMTHRQYHEGQLTKRKELVVANAHLADAAIRLGLDKHLRVLPFSLRNWCRPEAVKKSSKVLADAVEALLGAFLVSGGHSTALAFMQHLGLLKAWQPVSADACIKPDCLEAESDIAAIETALGYTFKNRWLVDEALTHCSWPGSGVRCFQRLEFLGDAVLDALITSFFYNTHHPRICTTCAASLSTLPACPVKHGLHAHVRHQSPRLFSHIADFADEWQERLQEALQGAGEQAGRGRGKEATAARLKAAEQAVLSDVVESLLGAVFVDTGGNLDTTWAVIQRLLAPLVVPKTLPVHPVRRLQELVQQFGVNPKYEEVGRESGGEGRVHVKVSAHGVVLGESVFRATNGRAAGRMAAEDAVKRWSQFESQVAEAVAAAHKVAEAEAGHSTKTKKQKKAESSCLS
ncbi:Endoribonuclease Dicer 1 [Chlorella vulgaris]